ncbi:MAG: CBS domain-containing protein [Proteobacteria bacterium]|nr:CBS domain-containing protein [Pseudomonadota bacterium]
MALRVTDVMSTDLITVRPDTSVRELAETLLTHKISGVPVLDDQGLLVGVVSQSDLIAQNKKLHIPTAITIFDWVIYLEGNERLKDEMEKIAASDVGQIMTRKVITVTPEATIEDVATIMTEKKVHTIPVLKDERLVGVIGKLDIVRSILP